MSTYIYDQTWQSERERLLAIEDMYDATTIGHLVALGVGVGWRCLEVGCGAGGVARWLADRVGDQGHVVATDLDPRFVEVDRRANLEVRRQDILADPPEPGTYDLVHARAVLEHIPARGQALAHLVAATRPGGWVLVEDTHFGGPMTAAMMAYVLPEAERALGERIVRGLVALFGAVGAEANYGPELPGALVAAGLVDVGAELHGRYVWGGGARDFGRLTVEHLRGHLVGAGLVSDEEVMRFLAATQRADFGYLPLPMVSAWGRRPGG